jgi:Fe-S-cluster-containing dehydrogenase component/formate-dependent nitrite reductase membrane component NrfD
MTTSSAHQSDGPTTGSQKNYGFAIDQTKCIGCHACSTACKSENDVPLGVHRTWVKYIERGLYPDVQRNFLVTRCNHCANPPCARICPVTAMYQRDDGIVEFDPDQCIGCKACMQACPYDAIHVDPETGTAAKCHYCAHRVDIGLEPACVVVCPVHAIVAGDLNDPQSEISHVVATKHTTVRKPEQGTAPKVHYVGANELALTPTATAGRPTGMLWSDVVTHQGSPDLGHDRPGRQLPVLKAPSGASIRAPGAQGVPGGGPIQIGGGTHAEQMVQVAWNAQHEVPWHWPVPAYLVTKGMGAGAFAALALIALLSSSWSMPTFLAVGLLGIVMTALTTALLVYDLERPERFLRIVFRPQMKSWLARGAFILIGFSGVTALWWAAELGTWLGWFDGTGLRVPLGVATLPLALGTAVYTAFLFAQAEGRDLWQSPLLPMHLVAQASMLGAGSVAALGAFTGLDTLTLQIAFIVFASSIVLDGFLVLVGELTVPHASEVAARAAHAITHGKYAGQFWWGSIGLGHVLPLVVLTAGHFANVPSVGVLALILATAGLYAYEHAFVMAPQEVPNS